MRASLLSVAASLLVACHLAAAHSWIEYASKIAPNGTLVGAQGFPRGYLPRNSTDPLWQDAIPEDILPVAGQSAFSGDEIINKYQKQDNPPYPMLEAAPGDHVALFHLENGHVSLPQNQPFKPRNRGTIFLYGTSQPRDQEKLFDVHLLWNSDGTGGDGRGVLLATRNYDDGQCYQPNDGTIATERAARYASQGASGDEELPCQSDVRLPEDLKPGSIYTIYWYWDWPDLDADNIDLAATTNGLYPWAGTFMRGLKDPHGFPMDAISKNESYSSVIDIKITGDDSPAFAAKSNQDSWIADQNIYSQGVENQMQGNYQVNIEDGKTSVSSNPASSPSSPSASASASSSAVTTAPAGGAGVVTVTKVTTVPPTTIIKTVYKTVPADAMPSSQASESTSMAQSTATVIVTKTTTVSGAAAAATDSASSGDSSSGGRPDVTPFTVARRSNWAWGRH